jgi:adenine-specific DNA-methyltransferase
MDFRHPYLVEQLIAYIGNKRALLPFLHEIFSRLAGDRERVVFLDPFAGSGAVSRLARLMGFSVSANDWEFYSWVINSCHLGVGASELGELFRGRGGLRAILAELNALPAPPPDRRYIARHYAPRVTETADWRTERLFYTTENALAIDAIRERIEEIYPGMPEEPIAFKEKMVLLAPLLYEAATHTNTSGVFKACHRGFGGHGRDALTRIMARIRLDPPVLVDTPAASRTFRMNAADFLAGNSADICYLDPPYATHQYGSNYFMLNTIAFWDKPSVDEERGPDGRLRQKAGIRPDWTRTRSAFCSSASALSALKEVLRAADCRWLVMSYSDEGVIGLEELCETLSAEGSLSFRLRTYVKYPGGKQSLSRTTRNLEFALVVDRGVRPATVAFMDDFLLESRIARSLSAAFDPARIQGAFPTSAGAIEIALGGGAITHLPMRHFWRFAGDVIAPRFDNQQAAKRFIELLQGCVVRDVREEIDVLLGIARKKSPGKEREELLREILRKLNKLAHKKYRAIFGETLGMLQAFAERGPELASFQNGLERVARTARARFGGPL